MKRIAIFFICCVLFLIIMIQSSKSDCIGFAPTNMSVPAKNTADNSTIREVIGNKTDDEDGDSAYSKLYIIGRHLHSESLVTPSAKTGVQISTGANPWTAGSPVVIIPTGAITSKYDIHFLNVESTDDTTTYQLFLYTGAANTLVSTVRFTRSTNQDGVGAFNFHQALVASGGGLRATLMSESGNSVIKASFHYHVY